MMLVDRDRLACLIPPNQHLGIIHAQWKKRSEPTRSPSHWAPSPVCRISAACRSRRAWDEAAFLGA
jgi:4-hydroxy-3-polyprenylbenzoate decarboxylase